MQMTLIQDHDTTTPTPAGSPFGWLQVANDVEFCGFEHARSFCANRHAASAETNVDNCQIELVPMAEPTCTDDLNRLTAHIDGQELGFSRWSFGQLCSLAKAPAAYMRTLPAAIVADALEYGLKYNREVEQVKTYADPISGLRAITGPGYGRVPDHEVIEATATIMKNGWEPAKDHMGFRLTDKALSMFLIDKSRPVVVGRAPDGGDDVLYRGLRIRSSEVGASAITVSGFLFRSYCTNGMIFGMDDEFSASVRHTANAPSRWAREIQPAIEHYAHQPESRLVDCVNSAKEARVAADDDEMVTWLNRRGLSRKRSREAIDRVKTEEGRNARTVWDAVQGVTALARDIRTVDDRSELEELGGSLLMKAA